jgi:hypothetical protein
MRLALRSQRASKNFHEAMIFLLSRSPCHGVPVDQPCKQRLDHNVRVLAGATPGNGKLREMGMAMALRRRACGWAAAESCLCSETCFLESNLGRDPRGQSSGSDRGYELRGWDHWGGVLERTVKCAFNYGGMI